MDPDPDSDFLSGSGFRFFCPDPDSINMDPKHLTYNNFLAYYIQNLILCQKINITNIKQLINYSLAQAKSTLL